MLATLRLLEASNGQGVRMSDIAKEASVSRQAVYIHFDTRANLLIAATKYLDELNDSDLNLAPSRLAESGVERLDAYIEAWGNYIPDIYAIAKALLVMRDHDEAAANAWNGRMQAMREGCQAAIEALDADNRLSPNLTTTEATDLLWTLLSVETWEHLTQQCHWPQPQYLATQKKIAHQLFVTPDN